MDFSNDFHGNPNPPRNIGNRPASTRPTNRTFNRSKTTGSSQGRKFGTPVVATTKSMELRQKMNKEKYQNDQRTGYRGLETIKEDPRENLRHTPFKRDPVRSSFMNHSPMRHSPIRRSPERRSPIRRSPTRRSPGRKPWQIDRNRDTNSNKPFGNSPISRFGNRDTDMDLSRRDTGGFIVRSPQVSYFNKPSNNRDFRRDEGIRSNFSQRKFGGNGDQSFRRSGRISDVSMRSVTPIKANVKLNDNLGSFGKSNNANPFTKRQNINENPFSSKQTFINEDSRINPFNKPQTRINPFTSNNYDKVNNSDSNSVFATNNYSNSINVFSKSPIPKQFAQKNFNPFLKVSGGKENIAQNFQIGQRQQYKIEETSKLRYIGNSGVQVQIPPVIPNGPKSEKELLSGVLNYFLHSQIIDSGSNINSSINAEELQSSEIKQLVVKPLIEVFLKDTPVNDSFKELYKKNHMHDVQLFFIKDNIYIPAHKIVLSTVPRLSEYIEARSQDKLTGELPTIEFSSEYDSGTFGKVLKLLYLGPSKIHDINVLEGRAMYRVA